MDCRLLLGFIALTAGAVSAQPTLIVNGPLGGSVDFNLPNITLGPNYQITWTTDGVIIRISYSNSPPMVNPDYENRTQLFPDGTLRLEKLTTGDENKYSVTIQEGFITRTVNYQLHVFVPISNVSLKVNDTGLLWPGRDSVSLDCSAVGSSISYSWRLNGQPLPADQRYNQSNNILIISPVSSTDNGPFTCIASNPLNNETSNEVSLQLAAEVSTVTLITNSSGVLWAGEDSVLLQCSALGSDITFSWSLDGTELSSKPSYLISSSSSNSNLTISPVSRDDTGPFVCTATNLANSENSTETQLNINWFPDGNIKCLSKSHKDYLTFTCAWENGRPPANVTMTFNGTTNTEQNIVSKNVSLNGHIQGLDLSCSGAQWQKTSTCKMLLEPPHSSGHNNETVTEEATEGQSAVLRVTLSSKSNSRSTETAVPLPATFIWYRYIPEKTEIRSGKEFIVTSTEYNSTLKIADVTPASAGKYECTATNIVGNKSFIFNLTVTTKATPPTPGNGLSGGAIAGIVIGVLAGLALIGIVVYFILRKN